MNANRRPLSYYYSLYLQDPKVFLRAITLAKDPSMVNNYRSSYMQAARGPAEGGFVWEETEEGFSFWATLIHPGEEAEKPYSYYTYYQALPLPIFRLMVEDEVDLDLVYLPMGWKRYTPVCWDVLLTDPEADIYDFKVASRMIIGVSRYRHLHYGWLDRDVEIWPLTQVTK